MSKAMEKTAREPLFSKKNRRLLIDPMNENNPHHGSGFGYLFSVGNHSKNEASIGHGHLRDCRDGGSPMC